MGGTTLVLSHRGDGTDLVDFPWEALTSLWRMGWGEEEGAGGERKGGTGIGM